MSLESLLVSDVVSATSLTLLAWRACSVQVEGETAKKKDVCYLKDKLAERYLRGFMEEWLAK